MLIPRLGGCHEDVEAHRVIGVQYSETCEIEVLCLSGLILVTPYSVLAQDWSLLLLLCRYLAQD